MLSVWTVESPFSIAAAGNGECNASQKFVALTIDIKGPSVKRVRDELLLTVEVTNLVGCLLYTSPSPRDS